jgi:hypothetical protein
MSEAPRDPGPGREPADDPAPDPVEDRSEQTRAFAAEQQRYADELGSRTGHPGGTLPELVGPAVDALPGLARIAASAWLHTTEWGLRTGARTAGRMARAATDPEEAQALARDVGETAHAVAEVARAVSAGVPLPKAALQLGEALGELAGPDDLLPSAADGTPRAEERTLRERGAELLERSRDVRDTDVGHPAYGRILDELAPDEARILLLLLRDGPQPSVDVRTGGPIGMVSSQLIAPGLTMIGARSGCRHLEQVPSYLNNLFRLGLVWFSREALRDPMEYQVVEAQPDVLEAMHSVKFPKVVRRSIHLTPFGEDFCRACFLDEHAPTAGLPAHDSPPRPEQGDDDPEPPDATGGSGQGPARGTGQE